MQDSARYNPFQIEEKWQKAWETSRPFRVENDSSKPKYYVLEMFPYPSGRLHMGHVRNYTIGDVLARVKNAQGFNVLHPMGWDAFGMPAENAAMKNKTHPNVWTWQNIENMRADLKRFGLSYDWSREVATCDPAYYGKEQQLFIEMYEKGLIYRKESYVNWDPVDQTVLANEQVIDGKGWRSGAPVERRSMNQWFLNITSYADELLDDLDKLSDWPERVKVMQENWIGRSEGLTFAFEVSGAHDPMEVYTTRPDTLYGVTYCAVAADHPIAKAYAQTNADAQTFIKECQAMGTAAEDLETAEKKGFLLEGVSAKHPLTGEDIPIYIANYVLMGYGTGAIMAVPAHDERDYVFAEKYGIPIKQVIHSDEAQEGEAFTGAGTLINAADFDGMDSAAAKEALIQKFEQEGNGKRTINYRLRDWGVSRQRYWGAPIPFVYCDGCGVVPVPTDQLPVKLPEDVEITGSGKLLDTHPTWKHTPCPKCGKDAERETDTMDTFVDSSWYFARYIDNTADAPVDKDAADYWMPVDQYIGGIEHAILHLLYARFFTKVLRDLGYVSVDEPFKALLTQGMVNNNSYQNTAGDYINPEEVTWEGEAAKHTQTGEVLQVNRMEKMSKSKNNGVDPQVLIDRYGCDTLRLFVMFTAPPERDLEWSDTAVDGAWRFLGRLWQLVHGGKMDWQQIDAAPLPYAALTDKNDQALKRAIHKAIKKVSHDVERFNFNTMIAAVMELSNTLGGVKPEASETQARLYREGVETCIRLLNPITPHITEELWQHLGYETSLWDTPWPTFEEAATKDDEVTLVVQVNGKLRDRLTVPADISKEDAEAQALNAIAEHIAGKTVRKTVFVPGRLVNVVAT